MLYILPFILEFLCFYTTLHGFLEISKKPKKAKRQIGYMPEGVPLYSDLTFHIYFNTKQ